MFAIAWLLLRVSYVSVVWKITHHLRAYMEIFHSAFCNLDGTVCYFQQIASVNFVKFIHTEMVYPTALDSFTHKIDLSLPLSIIEFHSTSRTENPSYSTLTGGIYKNGKIGKTWRLGKLEMFHHAFLPTLDYTLTYPASLPRGDLCSRKH